MSKFSRLERAFLRSDIHLVRDRDVVSLTRGADGASATVLLPDSFPLERKAVDQLLNFAAVRFPGTVGHVCKACATPDFHPGSIAPVGAVVATTPEFVIPAAIGTDINCGMRLLTTGFTLEQVEARKEAVLDRLTGTLLRNERDIPMRASTFLALFDSGPGACIDSLSREGLWSRVDRDRLLLERQSCVGLDELTSDARYAPEALVSASHTWLRDPCLGTPGSGNHFVELQIVDQILDRHGAYRHGLKRNDVVVMIHSGSRDVGFYVGQRWMDRARAHWPEGLKHPQSGLYALTGSLADEYLKAMGVAARYAWLNRVVLAEMVRQGLSDVFDEDRSRLVVDVPHNVVLRENGMNIHRKGATPAREGDLALIPGSMGDYSYVVHGLGNADWLWSCSHGAGRQIRRQEMRMRTPDGRARGAVLSGQCVTLREERRIEEAPSAYKAIGPVIDAQVGAALIAPIVRLRPWVTFKA